MAQYAATGNGLPWHVTACNDQQRDVGICNQGNGIDNQHHVSSEVTAIIGNEEHTSSTS